jgi:hypothetical protein
MTKDTQTHLSRRSFVRRTGLLAGGALIGGSATLPSAVAQAAPLAAAADDKPWPTRVLGRTGVSVTTMTLGTAPCGLSPKIPPREIAKIVNEALDLGINSIDTAPAYKQSEEGIGLALGQRRKEVFLATKVMADTIEDAEKSLSKSFELLKTDWFDLVYYHSVGDRDIEAGVKPDGVFSWLIKQKQAGKFRFLGISGTTGRPSSCRCWRPARWTCCWRSSISWTGTPTASSTRFSRWPAIKTSPSSP